MPKVERKLVVFVRTRISPFYFASMDRSISRPLNSDPTARWPAVNSHRFVDLMALPSGVEANFDRIEALLIKVHSEVKTMQSTAFQRSGLRFVQFSEHSRLEQIARTAFAHCWYLQFVTTAG
jgi:hypothetical protein